MEIETTKYNNEYIKTLNVAIGEFLNDIIQLRTQNTILIQCIEEKDNAIKGLEFDLAFLKNRPHDIISPDYSPYISKIEELEHKINSLQGDLNLANINLAVKDDQVKALDLVIEQLKSELLPVSIPISKKEKIKK